MHCDKCNRDANENYTHCDTCQRCRPGSVCWACEPEKAPDSWPGKRDALRKKQNQHSTTAPLHQNSGLGTPSTTVTSRPNRNQGNFLFGSNFMAIDSGMDEQCGGFSHEPLSLGAHSGPSVEVQQALEAKPITGDTLVWDSGGSTTKFNHLKWHTEIHPLPKPMTCSSANEGTGPKNHIDTVRFDAPSPDGIIWPQLTCQPNLVRSNETGWS